MFHHKNVLTTDFSKTYITYLGTVYKTVSYKINHRSSIIWFRAKPINDLSDQLIDKLSDNELHISLPHDRTTHEYILGNIIGGTWIDDLTMHEDGSLELSIGTND